MAKLIWVMCLFMFFVSCNQNPDCQNQDSSIQKAESTPPTTAACPVPDPEPEIPEPDPDLGELPHEALIFETRADLTNFTVEDEEKVQKAFEIIKKVVGSEEFRSRVIHFTYQGKKQFVDNKGMTNAEIYQAVLDGREDLKPEVDHEMDLELELYYSWRNTVGYTTPNALRIYMNTKFFNPYTPAQVAGNVFHEWTHKLGFDHDTNYSVSRDSSVPYALGYLMEELGKQYE
ncbi:hypothetical protein ACJVC5_13825 [Peredibacter sp. HCB2-198]|uniref:hypothetical protein n=1 Tax=Peredibacter sp. HCB2-198 TaxID=3383025 RepID=UPI0038B54809